MCTSLSLGCVAPRGSHGYHGDELQWPLPVPPPELQKKKRREWLVKVEEEEERMVGEGGGGGGGRENGW